MYKLKLTATAVKNLKEFNHAEGQLIAKKLRYLSENFDVLSKSKKVTQLKGQSLSTIGLLSQEGYALSLKSMMMER